jgi:hypothetical protein
MLPWVPFRILGRILSERGQGCLVGETALGPMDYQRFDECTLLSKSYQIHALEAPNFFAGKEKPRRPDCSDLRPSIDSAKRSWANILEFVQF